MDAGLQTPSSWNNYVSNTSDPNFIFVSSIRIRNIFMDAICSQLLIKTLYDPLELRDSKGIVFSITSRFVELAD